MNNARPPAVNRGRTRACPLGPTAWWALAALVVALAGCGEEGESTNEVRGTVTWQGRPVTHGVVRFYPPEGSVVASGSISGQGSYQVRLPAGDYRVTVESPPLPPDGWKEGQPLPPALPHVPDQYARAATSGLTAEVTLSDAPQRIDVAIP